MNLYTLQAYLVKELRARTYLGQLNTNAMYSKAKGKTRMMVFHTRIAYKLS